MKIIELNVYESLCIGDHITVVIKDINRFQVKLGVDAPRDIQVLREELLIASDANYKATTSE